MKRMDSIYLLLVFILFPEIMVSCDAEKLLKPKEGVAVETIEASASFDLSFRDRDNWVLYMGGYAYDFTVDNKNNKSIQAITPQEKPFRFEYGQEKASGKEMLYFYSAKYGRPTQANLVKAHIEEQSTIEKFIICDPLMGPYTGAVTGHISGISLYHVNALLDFKLVDIPQDAIVRIRQVNGQEIIPLCKSVEEQAYQAIVFPYNKNTDLVLVVQIGNKTYTTLIFPQSFKDEDTRMNISYSDGIGNSSVTTFTARLGEDNKLLIESRKRIPWTKYWPISR